MNPLITQSIVEFCRFARTNGLSTGVKETLDCLEAIQAIDIADQEIFKSSLKSILCSSKDEWDLFDNLFKAFWHGAELGPHLNQIQPRSSSPETRTAMILGDESRETQPKDDGGKAVWGASAQERLQKTDFSQVPQTDLEALEEVLASHFAGTLAAIQPLLGVADGSLVESSESLQVR